MLIFYIKIPSSVNIIPALNRIIKAFENVAEVELVKRKWKEIKRLQVQPVVA